ncbi:MAG: autotransporter-associated beta strand repeat-containing protein [Terrimicrobiaceae bacterium]|nr:autotransporter-associated beta strand repeat-containing protein [Terrimicrobiaceae bacterium]
MNKMLLRFACVLGAAPLLTSALADTVSASAALSATVQVAGPRTGTSGTNFLNVEGSNNNTFASYGVLDFNVNSFNLAFAATAVSNLSLSLTEANSAFTVASGALAFYLVTDTTTSIANDGSSPLIYNSAFAPQGLGTQLGATPFLLGTGNFSTNSGNTGSGTVDTYSLSLSSDAQIYFLSQLNSAGSKLRLVVAPTDATGASTWAGSTNSTTANRPQLTFNVTLNQPTLTWIGGSGTWNATGGADWSGGAWDSTKTAVFATGSGTVTLGTPVTTIGIKFASSGYTVAGTAANPLTLSSDAGGNAIAVDGTDATISAVLAGSSGLAKNGTGLLALEGANIFTGTVTINSGTLQIAADAALGAAANGVALNGGTLRAKTGSAVTLGAGRTLTGSGTLDGNTGLQLDGAVDAGALTVTSSGPVIFAGPSAAFSSINLQSGSHLTVSAPLTSTARTTFSGDGTVTLGGDNSAYGFGITMSKGAGSVGPTVALGSASALGTSTLFLNAGTLSASGNFTGANAISAPVSLGGSVTLSGGDMEFASFGFFGSTAKRLTVLNNVTISTAITSGTAANTLIKAGAGKLTLTAVNSYGDGTQILAGTLEVASAGSLGLGDVTVAAESAIPAVLRLDSNAAIDDLSNVFIVNSAGPSSLDLNFSSSLFESVNSLTINGTPIAPGDYSASNLHDYLTGTGNLRVLSAVPEPGIVALLLLGGMAMVAWVRRRQPAA